MTLDCIVCHKQLKPVETLTDENAGDIIPPYGGTRFESHGHYGSTVFDPPGEHEFMEINVCDPCLLAAAVDGRVAHGRTHVQFRVEWETFDPQRHGR